MKTVDDIITEVLANEGRYVNDPRDTGGETMYGITTQTARAAGYDGRMRDLPRATAIAIYRKRYVEAPGFDRIASIDAAIGAEVIDTGVNMGPAVAAKFLQRALNAFNSRAADYADLAVDGVAGAGTRAALTAFLGKRGAAGRAVLLSALNALQGERYLALGEARQANEAFMFGWFRTRVAA